MPFDFKIVEKREFKVVDINGNAIENAIVRQTWYQYAIGYRKESTHHTSSDGFALLPKRTVSTTLFDLVCGSVAKIYEYRINASFKSSDTITIHAENHGRKTFHDGKGMESKTVVLN
jgi:hypothetical protein